MSYPAPPPYATYSPPPPPAPPVRKGAGLAIASMVLGIITLLLCWIPIINNIAAVIALVGLGLGIPALIRARRGTHGGKGMAITGLVTSIVGLVLVFATQALFVAAIDEAVEEADRIASGDAPAVESGTGAEQAATDADPVPLGTPATVGDYQVTVDEVELNGNATVAGANEFNDTPAGQYVVLTVTATYEGATEGTPAFDLSAVYNGTDARQYSDSECFATLPQDAVDAPTLNPGGTATFQFCMDVPPAAIDGGTLFMEPTMSFDEERTFFAVQ